MILFLVGIVISFLGRSKSSMEIDTMGLKYLVDASELSFVCSSLTTGISYNSFFFKLCEAASFNATFSARKCYSAS